MTNALATVLLLLSAALGTVDRRGAGGLRRGLLAESTRCLRSTLTLSGLGLALRGSARWRGPRGGGRATERGRDLGGCLAGRIRRRLHHLAALVAHLDVAVG